MNFVKVKRGKWLGQVQFLLLLPQAKMLLKLSDTKEGADIKAAATIKEYAQEADTKRAGLDATGHVIQRKSWWRCLISAAALSIRSRPSI